MVLIGILLGKGLGGTMRQIRSFVLGMILMALLLGFLVGASSSPITGAAVTAVFGMLAAALTFIQTRYVGDPDVAAQSRAKAASVRMQSILTLNRLGWCLIVFSISFSIGLAIGIAARMIDADQRPKISFPWRGATVPASIRVAVDWIALQRALSEIGYSGSQIEELYRMSGNGLVPQDLFRSHPNADLLSPILVDATKAAASGGNKKPALIVDQPISTGGREPS